MKTKIKVSKLVSSICAIIIGSLVLAPVNVYADYLVQPVPGPFIDCVSCCSYKHAAKKHHKHYKVKKYYKHKRCYQNHYYSNCYMYSPCQMVPVYTSCCPHKYKCKQSHEIVEFIPSLDAYGSGRFVNLYEYDNYDPDMSTGDDDPTIYPGMNIDR